MEGLLQLRDPLVLDVVDGQQARQTGPAFGELPALLEQQGEIGGVPVVRMDDLGQESEVRPHLRERPGEQAEAADIVAVAVELVALKGVVPDEGEAHSGTLQGADANAIKTPAERYFGAADPSGICRQRAVPGGCHGDLVPEFRQGSR